MTAPATPLDEAVSQLSAALLEQARAQAAANPVGDDDVLVGLNRIARHLSMSATTVTQLAESGELPARKVGTRWRASKRALSVWLEGDR
ncbi:helix-turn-helix domain-containing protein [Euzebya sp.]|uniref:helix-turn-helix domain-containing protein n=1 Tax=Euzebya sp. TaxID=1971409 RepID=UPI003517B83A